jgi:hypothetical protein
MNSRDVVRSLVGGSVIYVAMAACSGEEASAPPTAAGPGRGGTSAQGASGAGPAGGGGVPDGAGGQAGDGAGGASNDASLIDAVADALLDPVADAKADNNISGTRLRARYYVATDGARQFAGWQDTQRNEACNFFYLAGDGKRRCMPTGTATLSGRFVDSACTIALLIASKGCAPPKYSTIVPASGATCAYESRYETHRVGAAVLPTATVYSKSTAGTCTGEVNPYGATNDTYASAGIAPATDFVEATEQVE